MKRLSSLLLALLIILTLCACKGNWQSVELKEPIAIPENGIITGDIIRQIQEENAIAVFTGRCGDVQYKWTIFGSSIQSAKEVNLSVAVTGGDALQITLSQAEAFGFSGLLSISLNEKWDALTATAYAAESVIAAVSLTGSTGTILNVMLDGTVGNFVIRPDPLVEEEESTEPDEPEDETDPPEDEVPAAPSPTEGKDPYFTDPIPEGKPKPVEPDDQNVNKGKAYQCTFSIECSTILNNLDLLDPDKLEIVPANGVILATTTVTFYEGESVFDVLQRVCRENGIHMEASWTPMYNSAYVEGIHNFYEFDCGALSGWMYRVNGWYPNYGCSRYQLKDGDVVQWRYTCDLGEDVGGGYTVGG